ncbi:Not1 N-terminal domain, CCR4-Not complex component-domain-containing protein [Cokeromyces recurvatus]|uniref:Not1 N-terminal domain, CCR4-Not complex component-domain-containing protein n=1 Tax=Cokeromyces recurvatus TaxID=90255 RepID=UPI00221F8894|nr:Not1 N-terminal domain, CCR4-Not complex component-domain-containing protein [Cokeromyces recurvatus]KAI7907978.1 Not1 N-terminal domain, CCR4-Not complex component-domain-containing protein [Cokeromyces recurvatus]
MSMKKLQSEIDRLLKKVAEGVETFEMIFDKIQSASNSNQKDKYEQDLKKEIKKLQRLRDQIKTWLANNDIKDKRALLENRKLIESQMEQFKQIEREMKTKAYSKEGLLQKERLDPKDKEKADVCEFITNAVDELSRQIETIEFEIEQLESSSSKRSNKKADHQRAERLSELEHHIERNKYHINRLELILRLLENDHLEPERINELKDTIQYYVDCNQEPDFEEDEGLYDDLDLEKEEELYIIRTDEFHGKNDSDNEQQEDQRNEQSSSISTPIPSPRKASAKSSPKSVHQEDESNAIKITPIKKQEITSTPSLKYAQAVVSSPNNTVNNETKDSKDDSKPNIVSAWNEPPKIIEQHTNKSAITEKKEDSTDSNSNINNFNLPNSLADLAASFESIKSNHKNDIQYTNKMLSASLQHVPDLIDSERPKIYQPRNPYNTPNYYPQQPLLIFDNPVLFDKFDMDTLFFIFYYQQGTYQQYLAAKELKKQSWRFHRKYLTWFQRHEEPKVITEDYEQGTYVYFDYEGAWCQRKKTDFRFDYRFLEEA